MLNKFLFVYFHDILIFSQSVPQHIQHVCKFFLWLLENQLYVKAQKCELHKSSVSFLGHVITPEGVQMEAPKIKAVIDWPPPGSRRELQILRIANLYRRFNRNYGTVAAPLTALTSSKLKFSWTPAAERTTWRSASRLLPSCVGQTLSVIHSVHCGGGSFKWGSGCSSLPEFRGWPEPPSLCFFPTNFHILNATIILGI